MSTEMLPFEDYSVAFSVDSGNGNRHKHFRGHFGDVY